MSFSCAPARLSWPWKGVLVLSSAGFFSSLTSCEPGPPEGPVTTSRDSAGVMIVENTGPEPPNGGGWSVSPEPSLSIGSVGGEDAYQLFGVAGIHRFPDGRIAVVNAGSREVRIFGADGSHLRSFGRQGGGPEEFEMPVLAGTVGDTLLVVDPAHHRISFVHPELGFLGLARVDDDVGGFLNPAGTLQTGEIVFGGAFDMRRVGELHNGMNRAHTSYRSCGLDGSLATDFGDQAGAEFFIKDMEGSGPEARPALTPFGKIPMAAVSLHFFYFSDQDAYEIEVYEPSGALVRLVRKGWDPVPVTPEDGVSYVEGLVGGVENPAQQAAMRSFYGELPLPPAFPPHGELRGDVLDHLWVEDFQRPGEENRTWNIFDAQGAWVGRLTLPESFNPLQIGPDFILGLGWDEMDVEYVRMYDLGRPE